QIASILIIHARSRNGQCIETWWYGDRMRPAGSVIGLHDRSTQSTDAVGHTVVVCRRTNAVIERRRAHYIGRTVDRKNRRSRWSGERNSEKRYHDDDTRSVVFLGAL